MARALVVVVCLAGGVATADTPKYTKPPTTSVDSDMVAAEKLWAAAEAANGPAPEAWEAAAAAFIKVVDAATASEAVQREAAYAAILAWKNALNVPPRMKDPGAPSDPDPTKLPDPGPIPDREKALLHALDMFERLAPNDPELPGARFLRANILRRYHHDTEAIPLFQDLIDHHPTHEVAEYAANLLLDTYNRLQRFDDLVALAERLRADKKFLADKDDLARTVASILVVSRRRAAENQEKVARASRDLAAFDRCGELYMAIHTERAADARGDDEVLYNALVCFQEGGSPDRALAAANALLAAHPRAVLAANALGRIIQIESSRGRYDKAAEVGSRALKSPAIEDDDWLNLASDLVFWRVRLGELEAAGRIVDLVAKRRPKPSRVERFDTAVVEGSGSVVRAMVAAGKRKAAAAYARRFVRERLARKPREVASYVQIALGLAEAACPVAVVDELCPRPRDKALAAAARQLLVRIARQKERLLPELLGMADHAARIRLDLDLETVLATRRPTERAIRELRDGYTELVAKDVHPEVRVAAHARLARLERGLGDTDATVIQLQACVATATAELAGDAWLAGCERELAALGQPADLAPERLGPAEPAAVPMSTEGQLQLRGP